MKYCPRCKLRVPETADTCTQCGGGLRRFGAAPPDTGSEDAGRPPPPPAAATPSVRPLVEKSSRSSAAPPPTDAELQLPGSEHLKLELAGLQEAVARSKRRVIWWLVAAAALFVLLVGVLVELRRRAVLEFATVAEIDVRPVRGDDNAAEIVYRPTTSGKVEFSRISPQSTETLIEHIDDAGTKATEPRRFNWSGASRDYKIRVRTRSGWSISTKEFDPPEKRVSAGDLF